jgi:hypothetical protein
MPQVYLFIARDLYRMLLHLGENTRALYAQLLHAFDLRRAQRAIIDRNFVHQSAHVHILAPPFLHIVS